VVRRWSIASQSTTECCDYSVISTKWPELIKSTVIVGSLVLGSKVILEGVFAQLEQDQELIPLQSMQFVHHDVGTYPILTWHDAVYPVGKFRTDQGTQQLYTWLYTQILQADIEQYSIDLSTVELKYIDFFAGEEVGDLRYGAYRLLQQSEMFDLSEREYKAEMVYLFKDLPLTIQGKTNEVTLKTKEEVIEWKTEVLEQQAFSVRLQQYYAKRLHEERHTLSTNISPLGIELGLNQTFRGWVRVYGRLLIEGCSSIPFGHHAYTMGEAIEVAIPIWLIEPQCIEQYRKSGFTSIERITIEYTVDDGFLNSKTQRWTQRTDCVHTVDGFSMECMVQR